MRVLIATPVYPPEVTEAAAYTKELARRLSEHHEVTVVAYTHLPEAVPGVSVVVVDKRRALFARLRAFRKKLKQSIKNADVLIAINGASVEAPLLTLSLPRTIFCIADKTAHERAGFLEKLSVSCAGAVVQNIPEPKPEILPLEPEPTEELAAWEKSWQKHLSLLTSLFIHD